MNCSDPTMDAYDIIEIVFNNLKYNNKNIGIQNMYRFTSLKTKEYMKTYLNYRSILLNNYPQFFNFESWGFYKTDSQPLVNTFYQKIFIRKNNKLYYFQLKLSRQYDYVNNTPVYDYISRECLNKYWRIDSINSINPVDINIIESYESNSAKNIYNNPLKICSTDPMTGFYRDGYCETDENDHGTHTVCTKVTDQFLQYTKNKGNDLITPSPENDFPGLKHNDNWCLCALRYKEAIDDGIDLEVKKDASHIKTLDYVDIE